jgi:hypothetical protein
MLMQFAVANVLQITPCEEARGRALLDATRQETAAHGYFYLVQANEDFFKHLDSRPDLDR